jgi:hypothetical protein
LSQGKAVRQLTRFLIEQLVPAALTAALILIQRLGSARLLPLNVVDEREYGNYALLLGVAAAFVASGTFSKVTHQFGIGAFLTTASGGLVTIAPFVFARYGTYLGLLPAHFAIAATFAYLGFFVVIGLLLGGCWSVAVKSFRDQTSSW